MSRGKRIREEYSTRKDIYGKRIPQDLAESIGVSERAEIYGEKIVQGLGISLGISTSTIYYALQAYDKYPQLDTIPEGKNITWNKLITKYLPEAREGLLS